MIDSVDGEGASTLREDFDVDGVAVLRGAIPTEMLSATLVDLERSAPLRRGERAQDLWRRSRAVRQLACHPPIIEQLRELYGRDPIPFQTLDFRTGSEQRAHRDDVHFDSLPTGLMCGVWIALEDVGDRQGPLRYHPGSHRVVRVGLDEARRADGTFDHERYEELLALELAGRPAVDFTARAGDALIWAAGLAHRGAPIQDPTSTRWSHVTHYFFSDCVYVTPLRSNPSAGTHRVREPLIDIRSGRPAPQVVDGRPARFDRIAGGQSRVLGPGEHVDRRRQLVSTARGAARRWSFGVRARLSVHRRPW